MNSESVLQAYINKIKSDNRKPDKVGSAKACYLGKFAVLKSLQPVTKGNMSFFSKRFHNFEKVRAFNNYLISLGVPTSKIYVCKYFENNYYELQERIIGRPLFKYNQDQVCLDALKQDVPIEKIDMNKQQIVSDYILKYNMQTIKLLNEAPQQYFDNLLKSLKTLSDLGIFEFDNNGENILYNPKSGFSFVDLDIEDFIKSYASEKRNPTNPHEKLQHALEGFVEIFNNYSYFNDSDIKLISTDQLKIMQNANIGVAKKIITSAKNNGIQFLNDSFATHLLEQLVGKQNFNDNFGDITSHQQVRKK